MAKRTRVTTIAAVVVALGVAAVGCGSDDPPAPATSTTIGTSTPATAPPTTQDEAADEARADEALLLVDEVPGGPWIEGDARTRSPGDGLDCDAMPDETAYFDEHAKGAPGAKAPELEDAAGETSVQLDVNIVATDEIADTVAGYFADDRFAGCLEDKLLAQVADGDATITDLSVEPLEVATVGDSAAAWSVSFTITQGTQSAPIRGVIAFAQVGRGFANVTLLGTSPLGASDVEPIMAAAADKLDAALEP